MMLRKEGIILRIWKPVQSNHMEMITFFAGTLPNPSAVFFKPALQLKARNDVYIHYPGNTAMPLIFLMAFLCT